MAVVKWRRSVMCPVAVILSLCRRARKERSLGDDAHLHRPWRCLSFPALPQSARPVTEEEEEEEDEEEKIRR